MYYIEFIIFTPVSLFPIKNQNVMQELLAKIDAEIESFQADSKLQAEKGNKAAGTRARKSSLELTKLLKEFRKVSVEESKK